MLLKRRSLVVIAGMLMNCASARMIERRDGASYGEADPRRGGGHVSFICDGISSVVEARRNDAYAKMREACGGPFCIAGESVTVDPGVGVAIGVPVGGLLVAPVPSSGSNTRNIDFRCVPTAPRDAFPCERSG